MCPLTIDEKSWAILWTIQNEIMNKIQTHYSKVWLRTQLLNICMKLKQFRELFYAFVAIADVSIFAVHFNISAQGAQVFTKIPDQSS